MRSRLSKGLAVFALVVSVGGHWFALQSVAWLTMTVHFARTDALVVALDKTFDGRHPCVLCEFVAEGKKTEKKQSAQMRDFKLDLFFETKKVALELPPLAVHVFAFTETPTDRSETPPLPPPRAV